MLTLIRKRVIGPLSARLFVYALVAEGEVRGSGIRARALFLGNRKYNHQFADRSFEPGWTLVSEQREMVRGCGKRIRKALEEIDGCLCTVTSAVARTMQLEESVAAPLYIRHLLDLEGGWAAIRTRLSTRLRATTNNFEEKSGLGFEVSTEPDDFHLFYDRMYLPFIPKRHGRYAYMESQSELREQFDRGFLLFVTQNGERVAGSLCMFEGESMVFHRAGLLDGDRQLSAERVQIALYYFQIKHALALGCRVLDLTVSLPFITDGVYEHKRRWGSRTERKSFDEGQVVLARGRPGPACDAFCKRNELDCLA